MTGPKRTPPTRLEEATAYEAATLRDRNICQRCLRWCGPIARDHRKNRSQGGWTVTENLQCLGLDCHIWKSEHPRDAVTEGWAVPSWADPYEYPARRWIRTRLGTRRLAWVIYRGTEWDEISDDEAAVRREGRWAA